MDHTDEINELRAKADKLEDSQNNYNLLPKEIKLAEAIHNRVCHWNHTDGCSWEYEKWKESNSKGSTKGEYLEKAKNILKVVDFESAMKVIKFM